MHPDFDLLVVEATHTSHGSALDCGPIVEPHNVLIFLAIHNDTVVLCLALVWTLGLCRAWAEYRSINGGQWHVVSR